ncbi:MAG: lactate dehydrogenase [Erythrobacter sp.]|nr:lactate dehydrogenase [Erythrobacter sp.]
MNPVEIDDAVSTLAQQPFEAGEFVFEFLRAFGNPETTIKRLRSGSTNQSDVPGAVLQRSNIHIATCPTGEVDATLRALRASPKTISAKARFILATDGEAFQAEDMTSGETVVCAYPQFPDHFGFFLPLAGITTVPQVRESSFDIKATGRLNRLYVQLLTDNPEWRTVERRADMNHFMARLIFCFFAEDTDIFVGEGLFTSTIEQMTARDASDTHVILSEVFRAMDTKLRDREAAKVPRYANQFPYVNGQLFSGSTETPRFSKIARSFLLHIGGLNWRKINPDIFGSMIQAVADDEERGALGMHYTSVPNILKVLNPLFLDDLRGKLEEAGDNGRKLLNLRNRMARIRVFDPACGSGNFLVIAYKEMRAIEAEVNRRRGEPDRRSDIPLTNFRGIELRDFPAEIARLALIIAEYQADVLYRGQQEALAEFLPLDSQNWITCANALRIDWQSICPPTGNTVKLVGDDLFGTPLDQAEIDFQNEGGETYVCGNPPYMGDKMQSEVHKADIELVAATRIDRWRSLDYICGFFLKAADFIRDCGATVAFVSTKSITQGQQVPLFWPEMLRNTHIAFAHRSFPWKNLATNNAGVTCVIIGLAPRRQTGKREIYSQNEVRDVDSISPYLTAGDEIIITASPRSISGLPKMALGNVLKDDGHLQLDTSERAIVDRDLHPKKMTRQIVGSTEFIKGLTRTCLYISDGDIALARSSKIISERLDRTGAYRMQSPAPALRDLARAPNRYYHHMKAGEQYMVVVPRVTSENRDFLPVGFLPKGVLISDRNYGLPDAPIWVLSLVASRLHWVWIGTVCVRMRTDFSYSNTLGWNTFPVPPLTERHKADLTRAAENILLAREAHFPATIAEMYDPQRMDRDFPNLRAAHGANDEVLERIYIGRRFRNDTERLEKLFDLYTKMTAKKAA